jgi:hemerythrin-like domain-containing protein/Uri superfamily endonuclease
VIRRAPTRDGPGTYGLVLSLREPATVTVGRLGRFDFPAGTYVYCGSALGGLRARVARHLRTDKPLRWHVDYLRPFAEVVDVWVRESPERLECALAATLAARPGAALPVPGFGSSDCRCRSHLVHFPTILDTMRPSDYASYVHDAPESSRRSRWERSSEMAQATEVLMSEHRGIERMLAAMERNLGKLESGDTSAVRLFEQAVDFLRVFADHCHHHKEEQQLFPALAAHGIPVEGGPVGVMLHEHEVGRGHIREMAIALAGAKAGDPASLHDLTTAARAYIDLLRDHIAKEDNVLFRMADRALGPDEQQRLVAEFDRIEAEEMGPGVHERYHAMLDELDEA